MGQNRGVMSFARAILAPLLGLTPYGSTPLGLATLGLAPLSLLPRAALAAPDSCAEGVTAAAFEARLEAAERALAGVDREGFQQAVEALVAAIPCLEEPLSEPRVARLHRARAIRAHLDRDVQRSCQAFAAARALEPSYRLPPAIFPERHPIRQEYQALPVAGGETERVAVSDGELRIDGRPGEHRPLHRPVLVQWVHPAPQVAASVYLWPQDPWPTDRIPVRRPLPSGAFLPESVPAPESVPRPEKAPPGTGPVLAAYAGAVALAAGTTGLLTLVNYRAYDAAQTTDAAELSLYRERTRAFGWTTAGLAAVSVSLGAGAAITWSW